MESLKNFTSQMQRASNSNKKVIVLSDMNLCADKWNEEKFDHRPLADKIKTSLAACGMKHIVCSVGHRNPFLCY